VEAKDDLSSHSGKHDDDDANPHPQESRNTSPNHKNKKKESRKISPLWGWNCRTVGFCGFCSWWRQASPPLEIMGFSTWKMWRRECVVIFFMG